MFSSVYYLFHLGQIELTILFELGIAKYHFYKDKPLA